MKNAKRIKIIVLFFVSLVFVYGFKKTREITSVSLKTFDIKKISISFVDDKKMDGFLDNISLENYFKKRLSFWLNKKGAILEVGNEGNTINISIDIKYRRDIKDKLIFGQFLEYNLSLNSMNDTKNPKKYILKFDTNEEFFSHDVYEGEVISYDKFNCLGIDKNRKNFNLQNEFNKKFNLLEKRKSYNYLFLSKKLVNALKKIYLVGEIGYDDMFERIDFDEIIELTAREIIRLSK